MSLQISIGVKKYKGLNFEEENIQSILPINLIIGKNNVGKSTYLDAIEQLLDKEIRTNGAKLYLTIQKDDIDSESVKVLNSVNDIIPVNYYVKSQLYNGGNNIKFDELTNNEQKKILNKLDNKLNNLIGFRIDADRNIISEQKNNIFISSVSGPNFNKLTIKSNGTGITNIIRLYLQEEVYGSARYKLVTETLLKELNKIVSPDSKYTDIRVFNQKGTDLWEIGLETENGEFIPISNTGSGIKTVLFLLVVTILGPDITKKKITNCIFLLEELENNTHPNLERNILHYIKKLSEQGCTFILTTHSPVTINFFSGDKNTNLIHLYKEGSKTILSNVLNYSSHSLVIDDIGAKASDILQSNAVIWVEGPSDRIYYKKMLDIFSDGKLIENIHYQFLFTARSLLAHYGVDEEIPDEKLSILKANRNSIVICDSDKKNTNDPLKKRVNSIKEAYKKENNFYLWITHGKETENYIPKESLESFYDKLISQQPRRFTPIANTLDKISKGEGEKLKANKIKYAKNFVEYFTKDNLKDLYDVSDKMDNICSIIAKANHIKLT